MGSGVQLRKAFVDFPDPFVKLTLQGLALCLGAIEGHQQTKLFDFALHRRTFLLLERQLPA